MAVSCKHSQSLNWTDKMGKFNTEKYYSLELQPTLTFK